MQALTSGAILLWFLISEFREVSSRSRSFELVCRDGHFRVFLQKSIVSIKLLMVFEADIILSSFCHTACSLLKAELVECLGGSFGSWQEQSSLRDDHVVF